MSGQLGQFTIEQKWRAGLERKGRDWVTRELNTRVGQPDDVVLEVVYEEPHPTRDFCQRWCTEQSNKMGGPPIPTMVAILMMIVVIIAGLAFGISDIRHPPPAQSRSASTN
jgi:hypothetical protein